MQTTLMQTAKVFTSGRSQAVRIPKEFRFDEDEVYISRVGPCVILTPVSKAQEAYQKGLESFSPDFMVLSKSVPFPTTLYMMVSPSPS